MRIGNQIHTANNKKVYRKPVLVVVDVDRTILLQTPTGDPGDGTGPRTGDINYQNIETLPDKPQYDTTSKNSSPFGGGTPNYDYDR
jgi:hypothetical protein